MDQGIGVAIHLFIATLIGNVAPTLLGLLDPGDASIRFLLVVFVSFSYGGSGIIFSYVYCRLREKRPQQQLQTTAMQRESLTVQSIEIGKALEELKKLNKEDVFKAVGPILVKSDKSVLEIGN